MPTPVHTPRVNNNDDVVRLLRVLVKPGDSVRVGDLVAEVETEKASFTVEAAESGFVLAVVPPVDSMIEVGSVLMWVGDSPDEPVPVSGPSPVEQLPGLGPTVKAAQLLAKYGLQPSDVPASGARLSAKDIEDYVSHRGLRLPDGGARPRNAADVDTPDTPGTFEELSTNERGMLRTVLWQRQHAVPGYVEMPYDAPAWERVALEYQKRERLLMNPLLALLAYRLASVAKEKPRLNSTIVEERRLVYDAVNVGFTVQSDTTLYLAVIRDAGNMTCRDFIDRLSQLQRNALAHRLRASETSGATVTFTSMSRWNVTRHIAVLPPHTAFAVAHSAPSIDGQGTIGATYNHRVLTGFDVWSALAEISNPESLV